MYGVNPGMIQHQGPMGGPMGPGGPMGGIGGPMCDPSIFGSGFGHQPMPHHGHCGPHHGMNPVACKTASTIGGGIGGSLLGGLVGGIPGAIVGGLIGGAVGNAASRPW